MKQLDFWFDPISPFAYLAFERLPKALAGRSYSVRYRPVLFAGLLAHWGQKGPAEVEPKRAWTFRHVAWLAHTHGIVWRMPMQHPFKPLALLRLGLACAGPDGTLNRCVAEALLHHVWVDGGDPSDSIRLAALQTRLAPALDPAGAEVKARLRADTDLAIANGVFGVPTLALGDRLFWGLDALTMVAAALDGDPWFHGPAWDDAAHAPPGVTRG